jgi:hypothetical protein
MRSPSDRLRIVSVQHVFVSFHTHGRLKVYDSTAHLFLRADMSDACLRLVEDEVEKGKFW